MFSLVFILCAAEAVSRNRRCIRDGTEIELVDTHNERASLDGGGSQHSVKPASNGSGEEDDLEHPPASQLRGQVVVLLVFLLCWASAAISTADTFSHNLIYAELIFGSAYTTSVIALGVFIVIFHCGTREDVRLVWKFLSRCRESGLVRETEPLPPPSLSGGRADQGKHSNDSLNSVYTQRSCSTSHSLECTKARMPKMSNAEAALMNPGGVTDTSWSGEMFYNPHQNGVARKFFRKHSRQQRQKSNCANNDLDKVVVVNLCQAAAQNIEVPRVPVLVPLPVVPPQLLGEPAMKPSQLVCRDVSTESQFNSSSQGLVPTPTSQSGNCSDQSLLIVEEEEEDDVTKSPSQENVVGAENKRLKTEASVRSPPHSTDKHFSGTGCSVSLTPSSTPQNCEDTKDSCIVSKQKTLSSKDPGEAETPNVTENFIPSLNPLLCSKSDEKLPQKSKTLPRSNWDKQCCESKKSKQPVYAYVNHSHNQKLSDILGNQREKAGGMRGVARSASTGDTELKTLGHSGESSTSKQLQQHPLLEAQPWGLERKLKKETAV